MNFNHILTTTYTSISILRRLNIYLSFSKHQFTRLSLSEIMRFNKWKKIMTFINEQNMKSSQMKVDLMETSARQEEKKKCLKREMSAVSWTSQYQKSLPFLCLYINCEYFISICQSTQLLPTHHFSIHFSSLTRFPFPDDYFQMACMCVGWQHDFPHLCTIHKDVHSLPRSSFLYLLQGGEGEELNWIFFALFLFAHFPYKCVCEEICNQ